MLDVTSYSFPLALLSLWLQLRRQFLQSLSPLPLRCNWDCDNSYDHSPAPTAAAAAMSLAATPPAHAVAATPAVTTPTTTPSSPALAATVTVLG